MSKKFNISDKAKKYIKIAIVVVLSALVAYVIYGCVMNLIVWSWQPRFKVPNGSLTSSLGFFVQFVVYAALLVIFTAADLFCIIYFYRPRKGQQR